MTVWLPAWLPKSKNRPLPDGQRACELGALGGTRTPNLLIRSQMLYPLSYERSHSSILHSEPCRCVLKTRAQPYSSDRASDFLIATGLRRTTAATHPELPPGLLRSHGRLGFGPGLFRLDPADQVLPADRVQQGRMVGGHVPPDHPDHLVIAIAAGHEPAFAPDQLHPRASYSGC